MRYLASAIVILSLIGCASAPVGESSVPATAAEKAALSLYKNKCRSCHVLAKPDKHEVSEWPGIVAAHRVKKVRLTDDEADRILTYLTGRK